MTFTEIIPGLLQGKKYKADGPYDWRIFIAAPINEEYECLCVTEDDDLEYEDPSEYCLMKEDLEIDTWFEVK